MHSGYPLTFRCAAPSKHQLCVELYSVFAIPVTHRLLLMTFMRHIRNEPVCLPRCVYPYKALGESQSLVLFPDDLLSVRWKGNAV